MGDGVIAPAMQGRRVGRQDDQHEAIAITPAMRLVTVMDDPPLIRFSHRLISTGVGRRRRLCVIMS